MFFGSDRSFALASDFGPCAFCQDGPREPTEIDRQVVKSAEIMCDTVAVGVNDCEQVGSGGLDERFISDRIVCFAAKSSGASILRRRNSMRSHFIHHGLPGSLRHFRIVSREVGASEIEIQGGLAMRFIHRI